ncbi:major facilitator superfamily domain-containing protein [Epithele typhae]|uniref:major facilitator superfamily domain-containing protein n=1 Tax=Epithele typhae TaxID=378194 RepID=UPI0020081D07|nr:major facilitator superfamily domain-containing protein [Epithele typhae]KAH9941686.1 major facilitator superfamily domain-containing protein [Epithele typhae]
MSSTDKVSTSDHLPQVDHEAVTQDEKATPVEEKHLVRRLDERIMPFICFLFLCSYLDRVNLGNARLQGLPQDILGGDPTGVLFDWASSAFYFSFILCPVPLTATSFNFAGVLVSRIAPGVFEGGFGPAVPLYLRLWLAAYTACAGIAGAFGGLLGFGIQHARTAIADWRLLFIVEGVLPILIGMLA